MIQPVPHRGRLTQRIGCVIGDRYSGSTTVAVRVPVVRTHRVRASYEARSAVWNRPRAPMRVVHVNDLPLPRRLHPAHGFIARASMGRRFMIARIEYCSEGPLMSVRL